MRTIPDDEHYVPIWDCPGCGEKDTPLTSSGPWVKTLPDGTEDEIYIWSCPECGLVALDESQIKGYASLAELEAMGWQQGEEDQAEQEC